MYDRTVEFLSVNTMSNVNIKIRNHCFLYIGKVRNNMIAEKISNPNVSVNI